MKVVKEILNGVKILQTNNFLDERGFFSKFFSEELFNKLNINFEIKEGFYSISKKNVIRGMHFQIPPFDHVKVIFVLNGEIEDIILDLRKNSKSYGLFEKIKLKAGDGKMIFIPKGFAHGFKTISDNATMFYLTSKEYSKEHDSGILWNSFNCEWNINNPIISEKDLNLIDFNKFNSPF